MLYNITFQHIIFTFNNFCDMLKLKNMLYNMFFYLFGKKK
jgi:hypothetical protein